MLLYWVLHRQNRQQDLCHHQCDPASHHGRYHDPIPLVSHFQPVHRAFHVLLLGLLGLRHQHACPGDLRLRVRRQLHAFFVVQHLAISFLLHLLNNSILSQRRPRIHLLHHIHDDSIHDMLWDNLLLSIQGTTRA